MIETTTGDREDRAMRAVGRIVIVAAVTIGLLVAGADARTTRRRSGAQPVGTIRLESKSVAVGIGFQWGRGTLRFGGRTYPFKVDGLSVNAVGVSASDATGYVYDLKIVSDFEGTYTAVEAAGTVGGGKGITTMRNGNGVRVTLHSTSQGDELKAAPEGVKFTLER
jgi:hypothetical protein